MSLMDKPAVRFEKCLGLVLSSPWHLLRGLFFSLLTCASFSAVGMEVDREYKLKAVYLLHFANFVEWPESAFKEPGKMNVCVFQDNPFGSYLDEVDGEQVKGRVLTTRSGVAMEQVDECHILYVGRPHTHNLIAIKKHIGSANVLLISEQQDFEEAGGIISYFVESNKLRIAIDADSASAASLKISSKLLQIAKRIKRRTHQAAAPAYAQDSKF